MPRPLILSALVVVAAVAACGGTPPTLAARLPGTYTAHETAATITYVVKGDGSATLHAVTNLNEQVNAGVSYTIAGDTALARLTPEGGGAPQTRKWTLRGDSLVELDGAKRVVYVRVPG